MQDFLQEEIARGPLPLEQIALTLAALSARAEMGGTNPFKFAQLMMAAVCHEIVRHASSGDEAAFVFNVAAEQAAQILCKQAEKRFLGEGRIEH